MESTQSLTFKVARKSPVLIAPAKPTPHEFKVLSDIDDHEGLRLKIPIIQFYRGNPSAEGKDPVEVIHDAIAKALVFYYPLAGRLREYSGGKLVVECTGEGVLFIEADAGDVTLQQFGDTLYPPFPCVKELLYDDVPAAAGLLHSPLLLIQVTRLQCGGFIFAFLHSHIMSDAVGLVQFLSAVAELARGAETISVPPIWERHLLTTREVRTQHVHNDNIPDPKGTFTTPDDMVHRRFPFGAAEFSALRSRVPLHLRGCSNFDLLTACIWRCRTIAISTNPNEEVRILCSVNFRKLCDPPLPSGYYGNAIALSVAISTAGELSSSPLHYALELVRRSKFEMIEELKNSSVDQIVIRVYQSPVVAGSYIVSDLTRIGFEKVDFGWGNPVYSGPIENTNFGSFYIPSKNNKGEFVRLVLVSLPENAMEVFVKEVEKMLEGGDHESMADRESMLFIKSAM